MSIIAVSDVHLGCKSGGVNRSNKDDFNSFLDNVVNKLGSDDNFVMCGDILDMWRRDMAGVEIENADTLLKLQKLNAKVCYVVGNHDYHLDYLKEMPTFKIPKEKETILKNGGRTYIFKHGYDYEQLMRLFENKFDWLCHQHEDFKETLSSIYEKLEMEMKKRKIEPTRRMLSKQYIKEFNFCEIESIEFQAPRILRREDDQSIAKKFQIISHLIEMLKAAEERLLDKDIESIKSEAEKESKKRDGVIVYGHTHQPYITENVANLGSWVKTQKVNNTYLEIKNGEMKLKIFPKGEIRPP